MAETVGKGQRVAFSPVDPTACYVSTDSARVYLSKDSGEAGSWAEPYEPGHALPNGNIVAPAASPINPARLALKAMRMLGIAVVLHLRRRRGDLAAGQRPTHGRGPARLARDLLGLRPSQLRHALRLDGNSCVPHVDRGQRMRTLVRWDAAASSSANWRFGQAADRSMRARWGGALTGGTCRYNHADSAGYRGARAR